ncbi:hypothetical protein M2132_001877 [Dysgonomonas sp. PH5-45]|uniref:hypothetical protein n=1 Tax=unclassified Dysgonomonas TaxID=2630389 RepID=UPI00247629DD|nr:MULTISPECIES: hypothetical protein [unclassified Dysgonomonas]MDH6355532.1 hypothetical protein [Dysgonomonas sp. PH5-45]MDH6388407.1 hypothetical protein [Dysgonomonas sp. PH5-37]
METLTLRIVFDQKGKAKKDPKKKAMIHIEVRDTVTNQKTYIPTNVKILFEHHTKDGTIISSKHPNGAILRKNVQSIFNRIEAFVLSEKCKKFEDIQNWDKKDVNNESMLVFT